HVPENQARVFPHCQSPAIGGKSDRLGTGNRKPFAALKIRGSVEPHGLVAAEIVGTILLKWNGKPSRIGRKLRSPNRPSGIPVEEGRWRRRSAGNFRERIDLQRGGMRSDGDVFRVGRNADVVVAISLQQCILPPCLPAPADQLSLLEGSRQE